MLHRVEPVEWTYDGLNGKVIKWATAHGNENHDPSILAFLVGADGTVEASLLKGHAQYEPGRFTKWVDEQVRVYEKAHPRTRLPFVLADVRLRGSGDSKAPVCKDIETAHEAGTPLLIFVGRDRFEPKDKTARKQFKQARTFLKKVLDAKAVAKEQAGWLFFRLDLADEAHAALAAGFGSEAAPDVLIWLPGAEAPEKLGAKQSAYTLAKLLKEKRP